MTTRNPWLSIIKGFFVSNEISNSLQYSQ